MAHKLLRLTERLYNTPHLVTQESLDNILTYLNDRNMGNSFVSSGKRMDDGEGGGYYEDDEEICFNADTGVGVIEIEGPLTDKKIDFNPMCGGEEACSYEGILEQANMLADMNATTIILQVDSGGGEAYGCFESANELRKICDDKGIKLITYVDGNACSAAYAWACIADEIILNPYAEVGSVGVVVSLINNAKALEKMGIQRTFVYAGDNKIPFSPDGEFKEEFIADIQRKVDSTYNDFVKHVSSYTGLSVDAVKSTQAAVYMADEAVKLGMADKVMNRIDFANYLADIIEMKRNPNMGLRKLLGMDEGVKVEASEIEAKAEAAIQAAQNEKEALLAEFEAFKLKAEETAKELAAQAEAFKLENEAKAKALAEVKTNERKRLLVDVVGKAKAEAMFGKLEALTDEAYTAVLDVMKVQEKAVEESDAFKELGITGNEDEGKPVDRVAALLAAEFASKAK